MSKIVRSIKNVANGYSGTQILVRKATSNDPSGPTTYDMEEISAATYNSQTEFLEIMDMLDRRLNDKGKNWRHVAKSLTVLDYLVRFGSEKCVLWSRDNLYIIKTLREFVHFDEFTNDQGALIRVKAKELVALLRDDERLATERRLAQRGNHSRPRPNRERASDPYDADLQRALEMSRQTAEQERQNASDDGNDPDLQTALKLSLEEEELRKLHAQQAQNDQLYQNQSANLLDLDDPQPSMYQQVQYMQPTQFFQPQQTVYQQYDMFGNPIQPTAGFQNYDQLQQQQLQQQQLQQQQLQQQQLQQQQLQQQQLQQQQFQQQQLQQQQLQQQQLQQQYQQIPQYTGFNAQPSSPSQELKPLKTGSNNPFALSSGSQEQKPAQDSLQQKQEQKQFYTQPTSQPQQSRFNDTHELNALLANGTGLDTFGNTGASRIPHQHTKTGTFINSSGTGYANQIGNVPLSSNATGNPFLNTGIGSTANSRPASSRIDPSPTGYGFGNVKDEPSLIDI